MSEKSENRTPIPANYHFPPLSLLREPKQSGVSFAEEDQRRAQTIENTLRSFGVEAEVRKIDHGAAVTSFALQLAPGVRVSRVTSIAENLALALETYRLRVETHIPGTGLVGVEVPHADPQPVTLREILECEEMQTDPSLLLTALGRDLSGKPVLCDLSRMPHLLMGGIAGSGKTTCLHDMISSLLFRTSPRQVRLILFDATGLELSVYNGVPHLLTPVIADPRQAVRALSWLTQEMLERYSRFCEANVRNQFQYNRLHEGDGQEMPCIVMFVDELASLMNADRRGTEDALRRLAALGRAAGIYLVLSTQRASVDAVTGVVKSCIPGRIAFTTCSGIDSRILIDAAGAEALIGRGDMLYRPTGASLSRVQGCLVTQDEITAVTEALTSRYPACYHPGLTAYLAEKEDDPFLNGDILPWEKDEENDLSPALVRQAAEIAVEEGEITMSRLMQLPQVDGALADRLMEELEDLGVVGPSEDGKPQEALITRAGYRKMINDGNL